MKPFKSFFRTIRSPERKLDFISKLPLEMSQLILRKLDPESLLRAAQVSRRWMNICRSDRRLKITARQYKKAKENFAESQRTSTSLSCTRNADANVRKNIGYCDLLDYVQCVGINQVQTPYIWDMKSGAPNFLECQHSSSGIDSGNMNVKRRRVSKTSCEETTEVDFIAKLPLEVSQIILRKLDPESLLCAARISHKWLEVCSSDKYLRRSARNYLLAVDICADCFRGVTYDLYFDY